MHDHRRAPLLSRAAVAIAAIGAAAVVTWAVRSVADETMYVFFVGAVAVVSWVGGLAFGLGAVIASILVVDVAFIEPFGTLRLLSVAPIAQLMSFALVAAMIAAITNALARAKGEAERLARAADQAKAEAEAASATKSDFLATLSHEVRTPINALLGYADLLDAGAAGAITDEQRTFVRRLRDTARHLLTVVNEILEIAKADAGRLTLKVASETAAPIVDSAVSVVLPQASAKRVEVIVGLRGDGVRFRGDRDRVREIVVNLLSNAVKFAPEGSQVEVTMGRGTPARAPSTIEDSSSLVWLRVTDHGPGISVEDQRRIFEPFVQGGNGQGSNKPGTGLGLAISRRLSRLMGGELEVESDPGNGASFTVWLRAA